MQVAGIEFEFDGKSFQIAHRPGVTWTAILKSDYDRSQLYEMVDKNVENPDGVLCRIVGVESFAISAQRVNRPIGLLLEPLERPF